MAGRFDGKRVFITGASAGIGACVAVEFARQGARVAVAARRADRLAEVCERIGAAGGEALPVTCDVRDRASLDAAVAQTVEAFGGIDIALANAGFGVSGPLEDLDTGAYRSQYDTNVFGVIDTVYAVLPHLIESRGTLGMVASILGRLGTPSASAYCSSKFAVYGLAESLRYELAARGVAVCCVQPGIVASEIRSVDNKGRFHPKHKDPAPDWIVVPTERAARDIVQALGRRKFNAIITGHGKLAVWLHRHFPWVLAILLRRAARNDKDITRRKRRARSD